MSIFLYFKIKNNIIRIRIFINSKKCYFEKKIIRVVILPGIFPEEYEEYIFIYYALNTQSHIRTFVSYKIYIQK